MVRIHFPPAESLLQTCLSREFAFLGREAAVFRGFLRRDERPGSAETRGRGNIWPKGSDISVGPYSSTAPSMMRVGDDATCRDVGEEPFAARADPWSRRRTRHRYNLETGTPNLRVLGLHGARQSG